MGINPNPKQVTICAARQRQIEESEALGLNEEHHCQKARATRKIDLAKLQQADCHLFGVRVNKFPFLKCHGSGNDFVLIDGTKTALPEDVSAFARGVCDRRKGVGADGLLLLLDSKVADYKMCIFNADGTEPAMCGNGAYCLAHYIDERKGGFEELTLETRHRVLSFRKIAGKIALNLGAPAVLHWDLQLEGTPACFVINTGVPHAVVWTEELDQMQLMTQAPLLRFHPHFAPHGVNVTFASLKSPGVLALRTYERGVEAETLACGTGAAASAFVAHQLHQEPGPLTVCTRTSFEQKEYAPAYSLHFPKTTGGVTEIEMVGSAHFVFEGVILL
jgi:diaminopimelate epimerase